MNELLEKLKSGEIDVQSFLEGQNRDTVQKRLMSYISDEYDKLQGSFMYDTVVPSVLEFVMLYLSMLQLLGIVNPTTSYGAFLTGYASSLGVDRRAATYASGTLRAMGVENTLIPRGSLFSTAVPSNRSVSPKYFASTEDVTIPASGSVDIPVTAQVAGSSQNVRENEIVVVCQTILGLSSVTNPSAIASGVDEEDDNELRTRFLERAQSPPSSGNQNDYIRWAKETPGVVDVVVDPIWDGPGTVKLTILGESGVDMDALIAAVKENIDPSPSGTGAGKAPIGAIVTVGTADIAPIYVSIDTFECREGADVERVKTEIFSAIQSYLQTVSLGGIVRIVKVEAAIGALDDVLALGNVLIASGEGTTPQNADIQLGGRLRASLKEVRYGT